MPEKPPPKNSNLSDAEGLRKAYASPDNIFVDGNRMYVAGTTPSPLGNDLASTVRNTQEFIQDWTDNFEKLPFNLTKTTKRYQQAYSALQKNPQVTTLIGHSLGGAVVNEMGVSEPSKYKTRTYSAPVFRFDLPNDENHQRYRTEGDAVAVMDRWAVPVKKNSWNPLSLHAYSNFGDIGKRPMPGHMPVSYVM
jgi:pimeloyl-ACP methyl ester carboxylesterase